MSTTPELFITQFMEDIVNKYPDLMAVYGYEAFDDTHYVEFFPTEVYEKYDALVDEEVGTMIAFENQFRGHSLVTFSGEDLLEVRNPIVTRKGKSYDLSRK